MTAGPSGRRERHPWIAAFLVVIGACAEPTADHDASSPDAMGPVDADTASSDATTAADAELVDASDVDAFDCDADGDGHGSSVCGGDDCDDSDASRHPDAAETCDTRDDDCDGSTDEEPAASESCAIAHGASSCVSGACVVSACDPGYHACGDDCAADTSPASCGTSCTPCPAPAHATSSCDGVTCGFACDSGYTLVGTECDVPAPRPIAPLSTATVSSRRPTLRWSLAPGTDGARVEICRDRACTTVLETLDATGTSAAPRSDLPAGVVFWRLRGRVGSATGTAPSPTWQLVRGATGATIDNSWGTTLDANGDGHPDVLVGAPGATDPATRMFVGAAYLFAGRAGGLARTPDPTTTLASPDGAGGHFGVAVASAGDVNGDGFADVVIGADGVSANTGAAHVYLGGPSGLSVSAATDLVGPDGAGGFFGSRVLSAGDVNGDGYCDVAIAAPSVLSTRGAVYVYLGGAVGLATTPAVALSGPRVAGRFGTGIASGDWNADGYSDLAIGAPLESADTGRVYVFFGSALGLATVPAVTLTPPAGDNGWFGRSLANMGDTAPVDGYPDLVVTEEDAVPASCAARTYRGRSGGIFTTSLSRVVVSGRPCGVAGAGDVDGDGDGDLLVGVPSTGTAYLFVSGASGPASPAAAEITEATSAGFGTALAGTGDLDGDGDGDVIVGAPGTAMSLGAAYVYRGDGAGLATSWATALAAPADGQFGTSVY
ncbi:VCBS repeat-containing protein [Sandaracinus amylolyticus]|uniref:VCBS repeat-containing protein n=1 Tax=Sandaracinus amylolyticus TaxID=927083 RepID=UPI001F42728B|nr:FG-GAP-like repeat-containing protein [Sandaracinus amylolyticus]UJR82997.1 Hypothetical protein I5071_50620 [Sandaracinus amylolyticus]